MYWIEITGRNGVVARLGNCSESEVASLIPLLADAGIEAKFGDFGSPKVIGGCMGSAVLIDNESQNLPIPK